MFHQEASVDTIKLFITLRIDVVNPELKRIGISLSSVFLDEILSESWPKLAEFVLFTLIYNNKRSYVDTPNYVFLL